MDIINTSIINTSGRRQMNVRRTCALPADSLQWDQVDWSRCENAVRRLQARIVKATRAQRWGRVKALQWRLPHSFCGKALAVKRVTENQGKRTPGVDGETWSTPERKVRAVHQLRRRGYHSRPLRRIHIPKANGAKRPLGIPTMRDRAMQALYLLALASVGETLADGNSYGFRPGRSAADAMAQCFILLSKKHSPAWVLEGDIRGCFDHISHDWLIRHVPMDTTVLGKWLRAGYVETRRLFPTIAGTPQGGIISPVLANLALDGLEHLLASTFRRRMVNGVRPNLKVHLVRYADDFIITGATRELLENEVRPLVERFLRERGLELSTEKTVITPVDDGFNFLGQHVRKYSGKLLITPSKKNRDAVIDNIRTVVRDHHSSSQENLIWKLNPIVRGWANYHRHIAAKKAYGNDDHTIWLMLRHWAKRRHPNKLNSWVMRRYWHTLGKRTWTFAARLPGTRLGRVEWVRLAYASETRIRRHVKIRSQANPYDTEWHAYFQQRSSRTRTASESTETLRP